MTKTYLAHNIKTLRLKKDLSQQELANVIGFKRKRLVSEWEHGQEPRIMHFLNLCKFFKCKPEEMLFTKIK